MDEKEFETRDGIIEYSYVDAEEVSRFYGGYNVPLEKPVLLEHIQTEDIGQGQGTRLMKDFIEQMKRENVDLIYLYAQFDPETYEEFDGKESTNEDKIKGLERLIKFYDKLGFERVPGFSVYPDAQIDMFLEISNKTESAPVKERIEDPNETLYKALGPHRMTPATGEDMEYNFEYINDENVFEYAEALHAWLSLNHEGQGSHAYELLSQSLFDPGPMWSEEKVTKENSLFSEISDKNYDQIANEIELFMEGKFDEEANKSESKHPACSNPKCDCDPCTCGSECKCGQKESEGATPENQGMHYSDPMIWQAALEIIDGTETEAELEILAEEVLALNKPLRGTFTYLEEKGDDEVEYDVTLSIWMQPRDPDVGIMHPYVDDVEVEKIEHLNTEQEVNESEFKRLATLIENDEEWIGGVVQEFKEKEQEDYEYAEEQKYQQMKDDKLTSDTKQDTKQDRLDYLMNETNEDNTLAYEEAVMVWQELSEPERLALIKKSNEDLDIIMNIYAQYFNYDLRCTSQADVLPKGWISNPEGDGWVHEESDAFVVEDEMAEGFHYYKNRSSDWPDGHVHFSEFFPDEYETEEDLFDVAREYAMELALNKA